MTFGLDIMVRAGIFGTNSRNAILANHGIDDINNEGGRMVFKTTSSVQVLMTV